MNKEEIEMSFNNHFYTNIKNSLTDDVFQIAYAEKNEKIIGHSENIIEVWDLCQIFEN